MDMTVQFINPINKFNNKITIGSNKKVSELITMLYGKNQKLNKGKYDFVFNGKKLILDKTILENGINENDFIYINKQMEILNVVIMDTSQNIKETIRYEKTDKASILREKIKDKKPELKNEEFYFIANGDKVDENKSIEENRIKNNDIILLCKNDQALDNSISDIIAIIIKSDEPDFEYPFACKRSYRFSILLEKLYKIEEKCKDKNIEFTFENRVIDIYSTLFENQINDGDIIKIKIKEKEKKNKENVDPNEISVIFKNSEFSTSIICNIKDIFINVKKKLLDKKPNYKNKNIYFITRGNVIETHKSIEDNKIIDSDIILVYEYFLN